MGNKAPSDKKYAGYEIDTERVSAVVSQYITDSVPENLAFTTAKQQAKDHFERTGTHVVVRYQTVKILDRTVLTSEDKWSTDPDYIKQTTLPEPDISQDVKLAAAVKRVKSAKPTGRPKKTYGLTKEPDHSESIKRAPATSIYVLQETIQPDFDTTREIDAYDDDALRRAYLAKYGGYQRSNGNAKKAR